MAFVIGLILLVVLMTVVKMGVRRVFRGPAAPPPNRRK